MTGFSLLSRSVVLATLASVFLALTACNDRGRMRIIDNENKKLKEQLAKAKGDEGDKKAAEEKKKELEDLQHKVNEFETANKSLEELTAKITEKNNMVKAVEAALTELNQQRDRLEQEQMIARAQGRPALSEERLAEIKIQEEALKTLRERLARQEANLNKTINHWKGLYESAGSDAVFSRINAENKNAEVMAFQLSLVGINLSASEVYNLREAVKKISLAEANKYKDNQRLVPSNEQVGTAASDSLVINDSYLIGTTANELKQLRDEVKKINNANKAIFMVVRLIEKVSVSLAARVYVDKGANALTKNVELAYSTILGEPKEIEASKEIDVAKITADLGLVNCTTLTKECLKELAGRGLLSKPVEVVSGTTILVRDYINKLMMSSAEQTAADIAKLKAGSLENEMLSSYIGRNAAITRQATLQRLEIIFSVNLVQDMPAAGNLPVDLAVSSNTRASEYVINNGRLHISMPFKNTRSVNLDFEVAAREKMTATNTGKPAQEAKAEFIQLLEAKKELYSSTSID